MPTRPQNKGERRATPHPSTEVHESQSPVRAVPPIAEESVGPSGGGAVSPTDHWGREKLGCGQAKGHSTPPPSLASSEVSSRYSPVSGKENVPAKRTPVQVISSAMIDHSSPSTPDNQPNTSFHPVNSTSRSTTRNLRSPTVARAQLMKPTSKDLWRSVLMKVT